MTLRKAVEALIEHVREDDGIPYGSDRRKRFDELDVAVWIEACNLDLEDKLPAKGETLGKTNLPGTTLIGGHWVAMWIDWWAKELLALVALAEIRSKPVKRTGRPRRGETDKDTLVISALAAHHRYEPGGSIGNYEPAGVTELSQAHKGDPSTAAISRFLKRKFPDSGYKSYVTACTREEIGYHLARWQDDVAEGHFDLRPEEDGRRDE